MVHGLPDYYRGVDIAFQALSEMIVRPRYGKAEILSVQKVVTPNVATLIDEVYGQGMLYGGNAYLDYTSDQGQGGFMLTVDGKIIADLRFDYLLEQGLLGKHSYGLYLVKYDPTNFIYTVGIMPGITFEEHFKVYYRERDGKTPTVYARVLYALVT